MTQPLACEVRVSCTFIHFPSSTSTYIIFLKGVVRHFWHIFFPDENLMRRLIPLSCLSLCWLPGNLTDMTRLQEVTAWHSRTPPVALWGHLSSPLYKTKSERDVSPARFDHAPPALAARLNGGAVSSSLHTSMVKPQCDVLPLWFVYR